MEQRNLRKERTGVVRSNKMDKTISVAVVRSVKHPKYGKYFKKTKTFYAHDDKNEEDGDVLSLPSLRPRPPSPHFRSQSPCHISHGTQPDLARSCS